MPSSIGLISAGLLSTTARSAFFCASFSPPLLNNSCNSDLDSGLANAPCRLSASFRQEMLPPSASLCRFALSLAALIEVREYTKNREAIVTMPIGPIIIW